MTGPLPGMPSGPLPPPPPLTSRASNPHIHAHAQAHSRSGSGSGHSPSSASPNSLNSTTPTPTLAGRVPGPPPPLVAVRMRAGSAAVGMGGAVNSATAPGPVPPARGAHGGHGGHGRSASISGPVGAGVVGAPVRKGSDGSESAGPGLSVGALGGGVRGGSTPSLVPSGMVMNVLTGRPFVAPPPPPPLVTVRTNIVNTVNPAMRKSSINAGAMSPVYASPPAQHTPHTSPTLGYAAPPAHGSPASAGSNLSHTSHISHASSKMGSGRSMSPPPPPPPPLSMSAVLLARRGDGAGGVGAYPASVNGAGGYSTPSGGPNSAAASTPSSARSAAAGFAWRYSDGGSESPGTAATTPASRESGGWGSGVERGDSQRSERSEKYAGSPLTQSAYASTNNSSSSFVAGPTVGSPLTSSPLRSPTSPRDKRERRRLRLHSPVDVEVAAEDGDGRDAPPLTPPIHSHPLGDECDAEAPNSALADEGDPNRGWLAALEGEVRGEEMDGVLLSPPTFASADPEDLDPDDDSLDLYDDAGYLDDGNDTFDAYTAPRARSPSPIRYARRASVDADLIMSDSSDEDELSDIERPSIAGDAMSVDSPAPSLFNDARSTFSRARSTRSRRKRRNTRPAPPPVPLASAAGLRRPRAHSADSSIMGFGDVGLAPSAMWRMEQAARAATAANHSNMNPNVAAARAGTPVSEMRYVYTASAARLPASIPPSPALLLRESASAASLSYDSAGASVSGHGHGSSESGGRHGRGGGGYSNTSPSTSKSSLPLPPLPTQKLSKKERKEREKERAREKEREKALRKSGLPHRGSFSLLRAGGGGGTANSSAEALMRGGHGTERTSSSSGGSEERFRPQRSNTTRSTSNRPALFNYLYDPAKR
ncbi:hypothetical protein C8F04DRAFT_70812 [Mycena alexandri]|uniref:Uncharacterized protein n=1 Tax=Mycena alexandri TaxID=1745969 RepID=A0AAD6SLV7_9AGAR|nr:hypothetical protein C8F04DRAFT_70812 [Mycena alexandri]